MKIEPQDLEEFGKLYEAEFGTKLTEAEVSEIAGNLVALYELLCDPLPSEEATRQRGVSGKPPASPSQ